MPKRGQTGKQARRAERQEDLRELLSSQGHLQHVIKICGELDDLAIELSQSDITRKSKVIDTKLKLINKYLPDLKNTEITAEGGGAIQITEVTRTIVNG
jgi:hypothetical protein